jgi:IS30 family transposase
MPKLSKANEYAIQYLHSQKFSNEAIATELSLPLSTVEKCLSQTENNKPKTSPAKTNKTKDLMIRQTSAKKINSVSIMTESASQVSDDFIKSMSVAKNKHDGHIYRPNN